LVELGTQLAFEVEEVTGGFARSVVVSGTARRLADDQAERAELTSEIASSPKYDVVEIVPRR
jgi:nitroimidazol reductase NimA-like FMN-containing flavoprotein (pyridoxamine 5'-phosphate oxidase superfamily)